MVCLAEVLEEGVWLGCREGGGVEDAGGDGCCACSACACAFDIVGGVPDDPYICRCEIEPCQEVCPLESKRYQSVPVRMIICIRAELEPVLESVMSELEGCALFEVSGEQA
jgi:hypothetical protein